MESASAVTNRVRQQLESTYGSVGAAWLSFQGRCGSRLSRTQMEQGLLEAGVPADDALTLSLAMAKMQTGSRAATGIASGKTSPGRDADTSPDVGAPLLAASELQTVLAPGGLTQTLLDTIRQELGLEPGTNSPIRGADLLQDISSIVARSAVGAAGSHGLSQGLHDGVRQDTIGNLGTLRTHSPGARRSRPSTSSHPWEEGVVDQNINIHKVPNGISHRSARTILTTFVTSPEGG